MLGTAYRVRFWILHTQQSCEDHRTQVEPQSSASDCCRSEEWCVDLGTLLPEGVDGGLLVAGGFLLRSCGRVSRGIRAFRLCLW